METYIGSMSVLREMSSRLVAAKKATIEPCLPSPAKVPPSGPGWLHEIKHDGYRMIARRDGGGIRLFTRNGHDWSARYPLIVEAMNTLRCKSVVIDGEAVVCNGDGLAEFKGLVRRKDDARAFLYAFDLLQLDDEDLRRQPIEVRKAALARLLRKAGPGLRLVEHIEIDDAATVYAHACALGCEGIVSKRLGSRYVSGRTREWVKVKNPASAAVRREKEEDWGRKRKAPPRR
jgi:bifunctional non-homologous end joining protein LigD